MDQIITGSFFESESEIIVHIKIVDVRENKVLWGKSMKGPLDKSIFELIDEISFALNDFYKLCKKAGRELFSGAEVFHSTSDKISKPMTFNELEKLLREHKVSKSLYSINEDLKPNAYNLFETEGKWIFFFLDERGERSLINEFNSGDHAYDFLWEKIENELRYPPSTPPEGIFL